MHLSRSTLLLTFLSLTPAMAQKITVYPGANTIAKGTSRQMTGYVQLSPNTVSWSINGVLGGNSTFGTVSQTGLYQAPAEVPTPNLITIRVASKAYPNEVGTAQISITQPQPNVWSIYPGKLSAGAVSFSVNGSNFIPGVVVTINGQPLNTVFKSSTSLTVTGNIPASMAGNAVLLAVNPAPGSTSSPAIKVPIQVSSISVSVSPQSASVAVNASQAFTANLPVTWSASAGSISSTGVYTAPASLPNPPIAMIRATSTADSSVSATATVTLTQPSVTIKLSPASIQLALGDKQQFSAEPNLAVTWTATSGSITSTGLYTAPASMPNPATVTIRATTVAQPSVFGQAIVTLQSPPQPMPNLSHARFLDQAAFGPTPYELQKLSQSTIQAWLQEQFNTPETPLPIPASNSAASAEYISRLVHAPDQLRQRVVNALTKVIVVSANKNPYPEEVVPYLQILSKHAFGSYRQMLYDITVSPQMGKYLDLANSKKASPNENYPRELMQLFTTGLVLLNPDGTPKLDAQGKTIAAYDQATVVATSKALTGWTYPTPAGGSMGVSNWESFNAPAMEAREQFHDTTAKTLIGGCTIPAGLTVAAETNRVIDCVFNHPNTAPFIVTRLIRDLVMSNPSPAYVQRVVQVWNNNAGDLKAVVTAILLDTEARNDTATAQQGRLKDPLYHMVSFIRAMNGSLTPNHVRTWTLTQMGQTPLAPPSVFGHYSMQYRLKGGALAGPEFQIYSPTEAMLRGNFFHELLNSPNSSDLKIDLSPFQTIASDTNATIELVNARLLYGRMTQAFKTSLATAMAAAADNNQRMITALYLTTLSGQFAVQY